MLPQGGGSIDPEEMGHIMDQMGQKCTEAEIIDIVADMDLQNTGEVQWDDFYRVMSETVRNTGAYPLALPSTTAAVAALWATRGNSWYAGSGLGLWADDALEEMLIAFRKLDKSGTGYVTLDALRACETNLADRLSEEDLQMIAEACEAKGWVNQSGPGVVEIGYRQLIEGTMADPTLTALAKNRTVSLDGND